MRWIFLKSKKRKATWNSVAAYITDVATYIGVHQRSTFSIYRMISVKKATRTGIGKPQNLKLDTPSISCVENLGVATAINNESIRSIGKLYTTIKT